MIRALYVDDEPDLLAIGKHFLERSGEIEIDTASSPNEAVEKLRCNQYDTIISDYQMPEMNGLELLKQVRSTIGKIPFIIFTGKGREEVVIEALNCGVDFYLQKGGEPKSQFAELEYKIKIVKERSQMKRDLALSKQRMRDIIDHLPDPTFVINTTGSIIAWNRAIEKMTGIPEMEMIGKGNYEYALPIYGERRPVLIDHVLNRNNPHNCDYPVLHQDGNVLETEVCFSAETSSSFPSLRNCCIWARASPLYNMENEVIGAIESFRDITVLKKEHELLEKTANLYKSVVEDQTEFVVRFLPDTTCIFVNEAYCRYFGKNREEVTGKKFDPMVFPEDEEFVRQTFHTLTRDEPVSNMSLQVILPGNVIRWVRWSIRGIFQEDGTILEYQSVGRDITDLLDVQDALHHANHKTSLMESVVRHDFRNYLLILNGYLALSAKMANDPGKVLECIEREKKAVKNIENLLNFALDFLSIGVEKPVWQNLNKTIKRVVSQYPLQDIRVDVDDRHLEILADPLLERIIFNLLSNSVKHGGDNLSAIRISYEENPEGITIIYEDNGIGISEESKNHLFEKTGGSSILHGLFIIREILATTGISISETGKPGKGARFEILIPTGKYRLLPSGGWAE